MASKTLGRDTDEFKMFGEFYQLVQQYYIPERSDEYMEGVGKALVEYTEKWKHIPLSYQLVLAFDRYVSTERRKG